MAFKHSQYIKSKVNFVLISLFSIVTYVQAGSVATTHSGQVQAFTNANILNPSIDMPITNATILVSKGKITKIQPSSAPLPQGADITNLNSQWVLPGLIDGHVHLAQSGGAFTRPDTVDGTKIQSYKDEQSWLLENQATLLAKYTKLGITTVVDLGGPSEYLPRYKKLSQQVGLPNIYFAGALLSPMSVPKLDANGPTYIQTDSIENAIARVKHQLTLGSQILKIVWSQETGLSPQQLFDIYQPAIALAKRNQLVVAIHVEELHNAKMAVRAGADVLVHGVMTEVIDDELIAMMRDKNVTYTPTLTAYQHYFEFFKGQTAFTQFEQLSATPEIIDSFAQLQSNLDKADQMFHIFLKYVPKVDESEENLSKLTAQEQSIVQQLKAVFSTKFLAIQKQNLKKVQSAGVNVALGTDAGNIGTLHASSLLGEMKAWQSAGISNKDILKATTTGNALAYSLAESIGSLSADKNADFIVLSNNPYNDISTLSQPSLVVKNGVTVFSREDK